MRIIGAIIGVGLIHYAFIRDQPAAGFYGIMLLALPGMMFGPVMIRAIFMAVGAIALLNAAGHGDPGAGPYMLLAAPIVLNLTAMLVFSVTLLPGRVPLITRFSRFDKLQTTGPEIDRHTRALTAMWGGYFALIVVATVALVVAGNFVMASWIVTVVSPAGSAALFLLEHLYRHLRRDLFGQASVFRTLRVVAQADAWRATIPDA